MLDTYLRLQYGMLHPQIVPNQSYIIGLVF